MGHRNGRVLWTAYSFILRCCQGTDEADKASGHKAKSPVTPRTKGVITEIAHGVHPVPGIRVCHPRHRETLVNGARLPLQGPSELEPAWIPAHPSPHSKRGSPSANPEPLILKLWTLKGIPIGLSPLSHTIQLGNWTLGNLQLDLITKRSLHVSLFMPF